MARVVRLNVTPLKSTALHHPERIRIGPSGAVGDREFFLVTPEGRLLCGSKLGRLVRIRAEHDPERERLRVILPDGPALEGPAAPGGERIEVDFWGRRVAARILEGPWADALTGFAGRPVGVARVERPGDGVDVRPLTLVSLASVGELARQAGVERLDADRFRMTIEIDGVGPHEEDTWSGRPLRVGEALLSVGKPVPRCVVTTQDPATGERDFPTLAAIRRYRGLLGDAEICFGVYASVLEPGTVRVGDPVAPC